MNPLAPAEQRQSTCELLQWDSDFFGFPVARVMTESLNDDSVIEVDTWAKRNSIAVVYFLARIDDHQGIHTAEKHSFRLVDIRATFECSVDTVTSQGAKIPRPPGIRPLRRSDLPRLREIARSAYVGSRFFNDRQFPRARVSDFYMKWLTMECEGRAQQVLVSTTKADQPSGYVTCHLDPRGYGKIELIAVHPEFRGAGLGRTLVSAALGWFQSNKGHHVSVVTQGGNFSAQRLYERCGFLVQEARLWFHKWYAVVTP